jgi:hypothetical protein
MVHLMRMSQGCIRDRGTRLDKRIEPLTQNLLVLSRGRALEQLAKLLVREG